MYRQIYVIVLAFISLNALLCDGLKTILYYRSFSTEIIKKSISCENNYVCTITQDSNEMEQVDAVIFGRDYTTYKFSEHRPPEQIWIFYILNESPGHLKGWTNMVEHRQLFNWTVSYRLDSTIPAHNLIVQRSNPNPFFKGDEADIAATKSKQVAWLVSDCHTESKREKYVNELSKYINVTIFGRCGKDDCRGSLFTGDCPRQIKEHKFYLSFENSLCKDYITEKFWRNPNLFKSVPVVRGPDKETYEKLAPPHSFIHVDDFNSPKDLANFLLALDRDDKRYNQYFEWKNKFKIGSSNLFCNICKKLHHKQQTIGWYKDMEDWWGGPGICIVPHEDNPYASWNIEKQLHPELFDVL